MICPTCGFDNLPGSEQCGHCRHDLTSLDRPMWHDRVERSLMMDAVCELEPRQAVEMPANATVEAAVQLMLREDVGAILVVDDKGELIGILSERDLLLKVAGVVDDYKGIPIGDVMTPQPETVRATNPLGFALHKMDAGGYRHLPVLDGQGNRPVGMISVRDMLRHLTRLCQGG
jgi:CBS domain-containing protein